MGRAAKATRGGNKRRINPGRLAKKFAKQGMSERAAGVAARAAAKMSIAAPRDRAAALSSLPPKMAKKAAAAVKNTTANKTSALSNSNSAAAAAAQNDDDAGAVARNNRPGAWTSNNGAASTGRPLQWGAPAASSTAQQPATGGVKQQIQSALAQLQQQRNLHEQRTVVKQAMRRNKK